MKAMTSKRPSSGGRSIDEHKLPHVGTLCSSPYTLSPQVRARATSALQRPRSALQYSQAAHTAYMGSSSPQDEAQVTKKQAWDQTEEDGMRQTRPASSAGVTPSPAATTTTGTATLSEDTVRDLFGVSYGTTADATNEFRSPHVDRLRHLTKACQTPAKISDDPAFAVVTDLTAHRFDKIFEVLRDQETSRRTKYTFDEKLCFLQLLDEEDTARRRVEAYVQTMRMLELHAQERGDLEAQSECQTRRIRIDEADCHSVHEKEFVQNEEATVRLMLTAGEEREVLSLWDQYQLSFRHLLGVDETLAREGLDVRMQRHRNTIVRDGYSAVLANEFSLEESGRKEVHCLENAERETVKRLWRLPFVALMGDRSALQHMRDAFSRFSERVTAQAMERRRVARLATCGQLLLKTVAGVRRKKLSTWEKFTTRNKDRRGKAAQLELLSLMRTRATYFHRIERFRRFQQHRRFVRSKQKNGSFVLEMKNNQVHRRRFFAVWAEYLFLQVCARLEAARHKLEDGENLDRVGMEAEERSMYCALRVDECQSWESCLRQIQCIQMEAQRRHRMELLAAADKRMCLAVRLEKVSHRFTRRTYFSKFSAFLACMKRMTAAQRRRERNATKLCEVNTRITTRKHFTQLQRFVRLKKMQRTANLLLNSNLAVHRKATLQQLQSYVAWRKKCSAAASLFVVNARRHMLLAYKKLRLFERIAKRARICAKLEERSTTLLLKKSFFTYKRWRQGKRVCLLAGKNTTVTLRSAFTRYRKFHVWFGLQQKAKSLLSQNERHMRAAAFAKIKKYVRVSRFRKGALALEQKNHTRLMLSRYRRWNHVRFLRHALFTLTAKMEKETRQHTKDSWQKWAAKTHREKALQWSSDALTERLLESVQRPALRDKVVLAIQSLEKEYGTTQGLEHATASRLVRAFEEQGMQSRQDIVEALTAVDVTFVHKTERSAKPTQPSQEKPADTPQDKPTDGPAKPAEVAQDKPTEGPAKPAEAAQDKPTEGPAKPAEAAQDKPS